MECNKEEAIRAKAIAEKKMQCRDFVGARKMVLKAQQLFPDIENISQMLTVCEVHCSSEANVNGSEDWYGILQVEPTADESLIKKQYRKLALLLHPDKNKFAGAEAAFKLVGEAHRTLSDQTRRSVYDLKRSATIKTVGQKPQPHHVNRTSTRKQPTFPKSHTNHAASPFTNLNQTWASQQQQQQAANGSQTFWTMCSSCGVRYQYYRTIVNKALRCQNCLKPFIAYDINAQDVPPGGSTGYPPNQSGIPPHKDSQGVGANNASEKGNSGNGSSRVDTQKTADARPTVPEPITRVFGRGYKNKMEDCCEVESEADRENEVKVEKVKLEKVSKGDPAIEASGNSSQKRRRKVVVESSDADSTDSEVFFEESGHAAAWNTEASGSRFPRRSSRQKQNVTYNEDNSDADDFVSFKRSKKDGSLHVHDQSDKDLSEDVNVVKVPMYAAAVSKNKFEGQKKCPPSEEHIPNGTKQEKDCKKESEDLKGKNVSEEISTGAAGPKSGSNAGKLHSGYLSYADPEFHDFEKDKASKCFDIYQIWATYDDLDGMPRFYARIKSVFGGGFKVRFNWLELDPGHQAEIDWYNEELPVSCGNFRLGKTEKCEDIRMFSHLMSWSTGSKKNTYNIYPRKGEVWALFKGWDIRWSLDPDQHRQYEYDIVEVLSDFAADAGVNVVSLVKVKGFVSLFCQRSREGVGTFHVSPSELLRFSHMVPSYRMTGRERSGIPEGLYELDTASLPNNLEEMFPSLSLDEIRIDVEGAGHGNGVPCFISKTRGRKSADDFEDNCNFRNSVETNEKIRVEKPLEENKMESVQTRGRKFAATNPGNIPSERMSSECPVGGKEEHLDAPSTSSNSVMENGDNSVLESSSPLCYVYPDSEFYNFDLDRSKEKFQPGQIWALYCENDGFPKYYALVRKVDSGDFKARITWLEASPLLEEERRWSNNDLPFGCGRFRLCSGRDASETYDTIQTFSHMVRAGRVERNQQYDIYPQVKEVWALYRNWSAEWRLSDLANCVDRGEYEMVEVLSSSDTVITVMVLEKVDGFKAVFRPRSNGSPTTMEISRNQYLKFSHRIPSFRLSEERGGKLRGYWELDPAAVPDILLCAGSD